MTSRDALLASESGSAINGAKVVLTGGGRHQTPVYVAYKSLAGKPPYLSRSAWEANPWHFRKATEDEQSGDDWVPLTSQQVENWRTKGSILDSVPFEETVRP